MKEEIIEGLRYALSKGESLEKAMLSFFNAGYSKEEIEDAARYLNSPQLSSGQIAGQPQQQFSQSAPQVIQRVSNYDSRPGSSGKIITIILVALLLMLLGILVTVFLFREELSGFLSNLL